MFCFYFCFFELKKSYNLIIYIICVCVCVCVCMCICYKLFCFQIYYLETQKYSCTSCRLFHTPELKCDIYIYIYILCGGQKEVWSPTKQLEHLQHHGEPHQGKQQGLGHPVRGFRTRDSSTTGVHHFSSNRKPQLQAVRDNQQLPHKREQRPQYSLSRGDEQMLNAEPP